jgi:hypothetical protein
MSEAYRRNNINGRTWELLEPYLFRREGVWGGIAHECHHRTSQGVGDEFRDPSAKES